MSYPIHKVALCTATGKLGPFLLEALQKEGFDVTIVARQSSKAPYPALQRVDRVADDFPENQLVRTFKGHDAVVLCLSFELLSQSEKFARASVTAGCRWLIASTYGANLDDPKHALFPASVPHRQAVDEMMALEKKEKNWSWTQISCGPWAELAVAAGAWNITAETKTARLVDNGRHVFTSSTRAQVALAVARILKLQPASAKNHSVYIASVEASMSDWLDAHRQIVGSDGWQVSNVSGEDLLRESEDAFKTGNFHVGYMGTALVVCTGEGYKNRYSEVATLANEELGLKMENMNAIVKQGLATPNPFA